MIMTQLQSMDKTAARSEQYILYKIRMHVEGWIYYCEKAVKIMTLQEKEACSHRNYSCSISPV